MESILQFRQINRTSSLPTPNQYTLALDGEYADYAFNEERAPERKGHWREVFKASNESPLDLEIGTGNGTFFAHFAENHPERNLLGMELKYKPLIQSIRRALNRGCKNAAICRYHAFNIEQLFEAEELNDVYVFFPDPWTSPRKPKNRTFRREFLQVLYKMQRPGSKVFFKTDSRVYFDWALAEIKHTPYVLDQVSFDLHGQAIEGLEFVTQFERIFINQRIPICGMKLIRK